MKKLFGSKKKVTTVGAPDAKITFTELPFIQYGQFLLDKSFRQYLETIMVSKKKLRMGVQKTPIQKTCEIGIGSDSITIDFFGSNRQFDWLEMSLVHDKSDKHTTIYDSYNVEFAAKYIRSLKLSYFTEIHNLTNAIHNLTNEIYNLTNEIHNLTNEIYNLTNEIHNLTNEIYNLTNEIYNLTNEIHNLTNEIHNLTNEKI